MSSPSWLPALLRLLERHTGLILSVRGAAQLEETFQELARTNGRSGLDLLEFLRLSPGAEEWAALLEAAVIPETHFYRVAPQMLALETEILPELLGRRSRPLRIWSAGCSSGEEAYTLAILLEKGAARLGTPQLAHSAKLLGTDLSPSALWLARAGRYKAWSFRGTPPEWRERYFHALEDGSTRIVAQWEVLQRLRSRVEFALYNLIEPPEAPQLHYDLIVCRNVTLYFRPEVAQAVYRHLASKLAPGGYLLLGPSDPPPLNLSSLEQKAAPGAFYWHKGTEQRRATALALESPPAPPLRPTRSNPAPVPLRPTPPAPLELAPPKLAPLEPAHTPPEHPSPPAVRLELLEQGLEQLERGEAAAALELLRRAAYLDPRDAFTHFLLGRTWLALRGPARARAALLHAQTLLSDLPAESRLTSAPELTVLDLRHALERLLISLNPPDSR